MSIYKGFGSQLNSGNNGMPATYLDIELIEESMRQILLTQKGQRLMRPEFGSNVMSIIFSNIDDFMVTELRDDVYRSISLWEPRVTITPEDIVVELNDSEIYVTINYMFMGEGGSLTEKFNQVGRT